MASIFDLLTLAASPYLGQMQGKQQVRERQSADAWKMYDVNQQIDQQRQQQQNFNLLNTVPDWMIKNLQQAGAPIPAGQPVTNDMLTALDKFGIFKAKGDWITLPDGRQVPPERVNYEFSLHPEWVPEDPRTKKKHADAMNLLKQLFPSQQGVATTPTSDMESILRGGSSQAIQPSAPQGVELPPTQPATGPTREGLARFFVNNPNIDPGQVADITSMTQPYFNQQDKIEAAAALAESKKKEPIQVFRYRWNPDTKSIDSYPVPGEMLPPDQAKQVTDLSWKSAQDESKNKGPKTMSAIEFADSRKSLNLYMEKVQLPATRAETKRYHDAQILLGKQGRTLEAKRLDQDANQFKATYGMLASRLNLNISQENWDRIMNYQALTQGNIGAMKGHLDILTGLYKTISENDFSDGATAKLESLSQTIASETADMGVAIKGLTTLPGTPTQDTGGTVPPFDMTGYLKSHGLSTPPMLDRSGNPIKPPVAKPTTQTFSGPLISSWNYPLPGKGGTDKKGAWPIIGRANAQGFFNYLMSQGFNGKDILTDARLGIDALKKEHPEWRAEQAIQHVMKAIAEDRGIPNSILFGRFIK